MVSRPNCYADSPENGTVGDCKSLSYGTDLDTTEMVVVTEDRDDLYRSGIQASRSSQDPSNDSMDVIQGCLVNNAIPGKQGRL